MTRISPDYQGHIEAKKNAIPLPNLRGQKVLDIGCDHGYWSFLAAEKGAQEVVGIDRNRSVMGVHTDLVADNNQYAADNKLTKCRFLEYNIGKQWPALGKFDVVFLFSLYHHIFNNCADHEAIWFWLWKHINVHGEVLWENPLNSDDKVVQMNVDLALQPRYKKEAILSAADHYFYIKHIGPAAHEPTREVYQFIHKFIGLQRMIGTPVEGAGGATKAFMYNECARIKAIEGVLGFKPFPGSLNVTLQGKFDWSRGYYCATIPDVVERGAGLDVEWKPRWCRFYPITIDGLAAFVMRFEGEKYPENFIEVIAVHRLRGNIGGMVTICRNL